MNKEWLITDTHFDHENIGVYCDRPNGWEELIIRNWTQIVKPEDVVIHLGDVAVGHKRELKTLLDSLPGTKILVIGNHDTHSAPWFMRNGFAFATDALAYQGVTFTHKPSDVLFDETDLNIHGHVHNTLWTPHKEFSRLLAIEHVAYKPVDLHKWVNMARSSRKWAEYMKTWKVPKIVGRKNNGKMADAIDKEPWDKSDRS